MSFGGPHIAQDPHWSSYIILLAKGKKLTLKPCNKNSWKDVMINDMKHGNIITEQKWFSVEVMFDLFMIGVFYNNASMSVEGDREKFLMKRASIRNLQLSISVCFSTLGVESEIMKEAWFD